MARLFLAWVALLALFAVLPGAASGAERPTVRHDPMATGRLLAPRGTPPVSGQSVIGADDRVQVDDTTVFPFSAIAYIEIEDLFEDVVGSCTGTFIGPDVLLTAAHCLWDSETGDWLAEHLRVVPGKEGGFEPFGSEYASDWWVPDAYAETGASDWDWGVIKLPNDLLSLDTGWMSVTVASTAGLEAPDFTPAIVGYPADKPQATMWGRIQPSFREVTAFGLYYDIDTAPGQSGAAIWSAADGPYLGLVVGIHSRGGSLNSGSRIDQELLDDILDGCTVMGCSIDVAADPGRGEPSSPALPGLPYHSYGVAVSRD